MRVRVEIVSDKEAEEAVIRCRKITPDVEAIVHAIEHGDKPVCMPEFFKGEEQYYLNLSEVLFFETENEKVFAHTAADTYETKQRLYELESVLPGSFVRISRSTIANTAHIFSIQRGLTRVGLVTFRASYKVTYASRMYAGILKMKMEERYLHEKT